MKKLHGVQKPLMTLVLVLVLMSTAPFLSIAAEKLEAGKPCSLTALGTGAEELPEDLAKANVVIDLYKVADAVITEGVDGYTFTLSPSFAGQLTLGSKMNADEWRAVTQKTAGIVLNAKGADKKTPVAEGVSLGTPVKNLDAGLYLIIARGTELADYVDTNAEGDIVTKASSDQYTYTFRPELVALPGREPGEGETETTDAWLYNMEVVLKMEWESNRQYGSLRIVKTLEGYHAENGPATFVFDVEAELNGKNVYSDVVSIVFDHSGEERLLVQGIPVGAKVTVREVYSGSCYSLVTDRTRTATIQTDQDVVSVSFTNRYNDRPNGGHGITNHFRHTESGWKLDQIYDRSQG